MFDIHIQLPSSEYLNFLGLLVNPHKYMDSMIILYRRLYLMREDTME